MRHYFRDNNRSNGSERNRDQDHQKSRRQQQASSHQGNLLASSSTNRVFVCTVQEGTTFGISTDSMRQSTQGATTKVGNNNRHRQAQQAAINKRSIQAKNKFSSNLFILTITPGLRIAPSMRHYLRGTLTGVLGAEEKDAWTFGDARNLHR